MVPDEAQDEARDGHEGEGASNDEARHVAFQNDARTDSEQEGRGRGIRSVSFCRQTRLNGRTL